MMLSKVLGVVLAAALLSWPATADVAAQPWNSTWNEGAPDCTKVKAPPPIEVHAYDAHTFVLRENLCSTWEAPFLYLLVGRDRPLLIDTGDVADPSLMPLAKTVSALIAQAGAPSLPLLVVHTHRHLDHRAGDPQFLGRAGTVVVAYDIDSVKHFYRFTRWPDGIAHIDLGGRTVDVIPSPGHNETHLVFYDRNTTLLFSGDFMMPGRLLIDDPAAEIASAHRVADFVRDKPVAAVLGGHIELDRNGKALPWQGTYHPNEHTLAMTKADLLALPAIAETFNGFYSEAGGFILMDSIRILIALAIAAVTVLVGLIVAIALFVRRRRRARP